MEGLEDWTAVIIEDDPDVRDLIDIVLTQSGFRTILAEDGFEGVDAVRAHNPLITTLDVNMPGMDGFAVAKRLREFSNTYLIFITALADEIDVVQGFEAGADDYLVKPFRPRELRARADSMLRRPRERQDVGTAHPVAAPPPAPPAREESWAARAARELQAEPSNVAPLRPTGGAHAARPAPEPTRQPERPQPPYQPPAQSPAQSPAQPPVHDPAPPVQQPPSQPPAPSYQPPVPQPPAQSSHLQAVPDHPAAATPPSPGAAGPSTDGTWVRFNGLSLDTQNRTVTLGGGAVDLTRTEFDLLASLLSTGRRVRSKADLVLTMRGQQYVTSYFVNEADKRSVEVHIANLRRKLGDDQATPRFIETVKGVGYRLADPL